MPRFAIGSVFEVALMQLGEIGLRLLRFLSRGPASLRPAAAGGKVLLSAGDRGTVAFPADLLDRLARQDLLIKTRLEVALSRQGAALATRLASQGRQINRTVGVVTVERDGQAVAVLANLSESPLAQLVRRKTKAGAPFLSEREFEAGERLRADYTRGRIMPRMGANWIASVASGKRAGDGTAELTDTALGARMRVEKALAAVGPELSGVLIDVCCFLKGLELVEAERGWPVRSAKIVLKAALAALARHYFPSDSTQASHRAVLHWGAEGYRPRLTA
jgi:hypothetical protein